MTTCQMLRFVAPIHRCPICLVAGCRGRAAVEKPLGERPLLSYLAVGTKRVAFGPDTVVESGRRSILIPTSFDGASPIIGPSAVGNKGDSGEVLRWMCYRLAGDPNMSLVLEADETSGGHLGGFELFRSTVAPSSKASASRSTCSRRRSLRTPVCTSA